MTAVVLHVEDDPAQTILLRHLMRRRPELELRHVESVAAALEEIARHRPALIICDLNLPDMGGDVVVDVLHAAVDGQIPMIVVTADADARARLAADPLHGCEVVAHTKPIDVAELLADVDSRLGGASR